MVQLTLVEKIQSLLEIVKSSSLFIIAFLIGAAIISLIIMDYISNKKVNGKLYISALVFTMGFILVKYFKPLLNLADNLVEEIISIIYFPNLAVFLFILLSINVITLYTLIKNKYFIHKIISVISAISIDFLFILILDIIAKNNIDIYAKLTVFSNKELLVLIELTTGIYTVWALITGFVKLVNKTCSNTKTIPAYVIPTPNDTFLNVPVYEAYKEDGKTLYDRFGKGENLSKEQYAILKTYLMSK